MLYNYAVFSTLQTLIPDHQCDWSGTTLIFNISMPLCLADVEVFFSFNSIGNILALKTHLTSTLSVQKRSGRRDWEKRLRAHFDSLDGPAPDASDQARKGLGSKQNSGYRNCFLYQYQ